MSLDLPRWDVRRADLRAVFEDVGAVVHLAWDTNVDNARSGTLSPDNTLMTFRVYEAAAACRVPRVIMASSVHADRSHTWDGPGLLSPHDVPWPDSPYGAGKVMMEALGRYFAASRGLDVICIRFGAVTRTNGRPSAPPERGFWLTQEDCVALVDRCLEADVVPGRFVVMYGVSDGGRRVVDLNNPLGWQPAPGRVGVGRSVAPPAEPPRRRVSAALRRRLRR